MVPITLNLTGIVPASTYGVIDYPGHDSIATVDEKIVTDVLVYVFDNTYSCEEILQGTTYNNIETKLVKVGMKHFIAVVNGPTHFTGANALPATPAAVSYSNLRKMLTNASTSLPTPGAAKPFLMAGERLNVMLDQQKAEDDPYKISIDVERACAKITMQFSKDGQAALANITLKKVTLFQGASSVCLLDVPDVNPTTYDLTAVKNTFRNPVDPPNPAVVPKTSDGWSNLADSFYTYESRCGADKSKAVYFEIEAEINSPTNVRTARFYLAEWEWASLDTIYTIRRNYWYDIKVKMTDPGLDSVYVTVVACPWNTAPVQVDTVGGGAIVETSQPFKLVKQYTAAELGGTDLTWGTGGNRAFAAIKKHTRGAAWIALKVSDGTPWRLDFKGNTDTETNSVYYGSSMSLENGASWTPPSTTGAGVSGVGHYRNPGDPADTVFIYRPYREDKEPKEGPQLQLTVGGKVVREFTVQPRDTVPIPTNSYILRPRLKGTPLNESRVYIPLAGVYRQWEDYLMANGESIPDGTITAKVEWHDRSRAIVTEPRVINATKRDSAYIYLEADTTQGNAIISVSVDKVYWTYHIWVTEYNPYTAAGQKLYPQVAGASNIFMDRNLGALANKDSLLDPGAGESMGLYYQYGRSAPFPNGDKWSTNGEIRYFYGNPLIYHQGSTVTGPASIEVSTALRPKKAIATSISTPLKYIPNVSGSYPLWDENHYLWADSLGNHKTAYDPCPEGWRVPKQATTLSFDSPWRNITTSGMLHPSTIAPWERGFYHIDAGYYPYAGYFDVETLRSQGVGTAGYYWTAWTGANNGTSYGMTFTDAPSFAISGILQMRHGYSVRCVVDEDYIAAGSGLFGANGGQLGNGGDL
jgi:hypothetical protein